MYKADLIQLIKEKACKQGYFSLSSGKESNLFIDCKQISLSCEGNHMISRVLFDEILFLKAEHSLNTIAVAGVELGGCPLASAVSSYSYEIFPMDCLYVRKQVKNHGTNVVIEGTTNKNSSIILLEDVVTTGKSSLDAAKKLKIDGYNVFAIIALVDRLEGGKELIEAEGMKFVSVCNSNQLAL